MQEKIFVDGMFYEVPDNVPEFVKGKLAFKVAEFIEFLKKNERNNGFVYVDLKKSQGGKNYAELNTWTPKNEQEKAVKEEIENQTSLNNMDKVEYPDEQINIEDIPF